MPRGARRARNQGTVVKRTLLSVLMLSNLLAGCVVVPMGRPWHRDYVEAAPVVVVHDGGWRR
jgi:hypothetical protein